jgi:hypothetical protein
MMIGKSIKIFNFIHQSILSFLQLNLQLFSNYLSNFLVKLNYVPLGKRLSPAFVYDFILFYHRIDLMVSKIKVCITDVQGNEIYVSNKFPSADSALGEGYKSSNNGLIIKC